MDADAVWGVIARERRALGDILGDLTPQQWDHESLCAGWTVRDVAAHVISWPQTTLGQALVALGRARGSFDRMNLEEARRRAERPTQQIVADFERLAESRHRPPMVDAPEALVDVLVHTQDIAIPLGIEHDMPLDAAVQCASRYWRRRFPFRARQRLAGLRLEATDVAWSVGDGVPVRGPVSALLLLVTGRQAALRRLSGEGAEQLQRAG